MLVYDVTQTTYSSIQGPSTMYCNNIVQAIFLAGRDWNNSIVLQYIAIVSTEQQAILLLLQSDCNSNTSLTPENQILLKQQNN